MSRSLKIFVTLSMLLNVVLISAAGVAVYKKIQIRSENAVLSDDARAKLKGAVNIDRRQAFQNIRQIKEKSKTLKSILEAESFDSAAYNDAMNDLLDMRDKMARDRAVKMGEAMKTLSVEERKQLSKSLVRSLSKNQRKRPNQNRERPIP